MNTEQANEEKIVKGQSQLTVYETNCHGKLHFVGIGSSSHAQRVSAKTKRSTSLGKNVKIRCIVFVSEICKNLNWISDIGHAITISDFIVDIQTNVSLEPETHFGFYLVSIFLNTIECSCIALLGLSVVV